jgi:short-subunit dehydrogenase
VKHVVITGSTRGIGLGLADAFLSQQCEVTICGRTSESTKRAIDELSTRHKWEHIFGISTDVTQFHQLEVLWQEAHNHFGKVDIWINNAGIAHSPQKSWDQSADIIKSVVETNILGTMYGSKIALQGMLEQGFGCLYNMEGMGSDGRRHDGMSYYGSSKYCLNYFNQGLVEETRGKPVLVGSIRPGMVYTDLITRQFEGRAKEWEQFKPIFNILAERVEIVAPWLADNILKNKKHGACIRYSNGTKLFRKLMVELVERIKSI